MLIAVKQIDPRRCPPDSPLRDLSQFYGELSSDFTPPRGCFLLAADWSGPIIVAGAGGFRPLSPVICEFRRVVVLPEFQRGGIGRCLLRALIDQAVKAGYTKARTEVPANVEALVEFYTRSGFREVPPYRPAVADESRYFELVLGHDGTR